MAESASAVVRSLWERPLPSSSFTLHAGERDAVADEDGVHRGGAAREGGGTALAERGEQNAGDFVLSRR
ncbi:hypothetical protein SAMN05216489_04962 [Streptomyces sp. 3213]|uniref:hypothetical protein n=1 Tax=Streptomyces sp. 3213.3 TaxID=1855348 RepID=UPI00089C8B49|nr:hypothetical protein [Streptomyces sp. 3213.3]SED93379.1 hypothetical protein SAMN05216489_04962 [Streptomyces sp. 3213] [Streptomyces sp. 3213.3]